MLRILRCMFGRLVSRHTHAYASQQLRQDSGHRDFQLRTWTLRTHHWAFVDPEGTGHDIRISASRIFGRVTIDNNELARILQAA